MKAKEQSRAIDSSCAALVVLALAVVCASGARAKEIGKDKPDGHVRLEETIISGNQELPKVLYIVPWQDPSGMPNIQLDPGFTEQEVFRRLYPPAYKREIDYYELLDASTDASEKED